MELKLLNLPTKEIYQDLFQPATKKVGEALSTVLDSANLVLLPLKLLNERSKVYFENNIKRYSEKLEHKDLTPTQVPQYIGLPIIDKLTYLEQNELSEAFLNLLTKASFVESMNLAHPSFVNILNNLSQDEAKILFHYKDSERIPYIDIYIRRYQEKIDKPDESNRKTLTGIKKMIDYTFQDRKEVNIKYGSNLTGIETEVKLTYPSNIDIYIDNLLHNGLIFLEKETILVSDNSRYEELEKKVYPNLYVDLKKIIEEDVQVQEHNIGFKFDIVTNKHSIMFTELGKSFLSACIKE